MAETKAITLPKETFGKHKKSVKRNKAATHFLFMNPHIIHCCRALEIHEGRSDDPMYPKQLRLRF
jgi:hypothetical protein